MSIRAPLPGRRRAGDAEADVEAVEGGQGQRDGDDHQVADEVPAAQGPRRSRRRAGCRRSPSRAGRSSSDVGHEGARPAGRPCATRSGRSRSTSSPSSASPCRRAGRRPPADGADQQQAADEERHGARADGVGLGVRRVEAQRVDEHDHPDRGRAGARSPARRGRGLTGSPSSRSRERRRSCQPQLGQRVATRLSCSSRKVAKSSPVRTRRSSRCPRAPASTPRSRASPRGRRSGGLVGVADPGGRTRPRQLVKTRSMPDSFRVGASTLSRRSSPLVASTRIWPLSIWSRNSPAPEVAKSILSPSRAGSRSPPPS